jgi:hypothetical protein
MSLQAFRLKICVRFSFLPFVALIVFDKEYWPVAGVGRGASSAVAPGG